VQRGLEYRIRRAAAYAQVQDAKFPVVSVRTRTQSTEEKERMGSYAALTDQLGGEFIHLHGRSVARGTDGRLVTRQTRLFAACQGLTSTS